VGGVGFIERRLRKAERIRSPSPPLSGTTATWLAGANRVRRIGHQKPARYGNGRAHRAYQPFPPLELIAMPSTLVPPGERTYHSAPNPSRFWPVVSPGFASLW